MKYLLEHDDALVSLDEGFAGLPVDPYTPGDFRYRRYSAFRLADGRVELLPPETFTQGKDINRFLGDVERTYEPIEETTWGSPAFAAMLAHFEEHTAVRIGAHIGVHQVRVYERDGAALTPEGRHQDGFDRIAVYMIGRQNLDGGNLRLSESATAEAFLELPLMPGDYVVLNDRALFHNASPIERIDPAQEGYADFFVATSCDDSATVTRH